MIHSKIDETLSVKIIVFRPILFKHFDIQLQYARLVTDRMLSINDLDATSINQE